MEQPRPEHEPTPEEREFQLREEAYRQAEQLDNAIRAWWHALADLEKARGIVRPPEKEYANDAEALLALSDGMVRMLHSASTANPDTRRENLDQLRQKLAYAGDIFGLDVASLYTPEELKAHADFKEHHRQTRADDAQWLKEHGLHMPEDDHP